MEKTLKTLLLAAGGKGVFIGLFGVFVASKLAPRLVKQYTFSYAKAYYGTVFSTILAINAISFLITCFE